MTLPFLSHQERDALRGNTLVSPEEAEAVAQISADSFTQQITNT